MAKSDRNRQRSLRSFLSFCGDVGFAPEPFQRRIASAFFGPEREFLALLPRGQGKSCLIAALSVHHLVETASPRVYVAAASREQASVVHEYAREFARAADPEIVVNQREIRTADGYLRIVASDAGKLQGLTPSLAVVDELHAHKDAAVYLAMRTALLKRPGAKMAVISTAGQGATSPLGELRRRALAADDVRRRGVITDARSDTLRMLEWAAREDHAIDDMGEAKRVNPASWVTTAGLREQYEALPEIAWRRYHRNEWTARLGSWLPAGAWQSCANGTRPEEGSEIFVGLDIGGSRADTACVWIDREGRVDCRIWSGDDALMDVTAFLPALAQKFRIREVVYDPWRAQTLAKIAEAHGIPVTPFAQSDARMIPASAALHQAIVERKISHPNDERLNEHVAAAVARHGRRGWRIDQAERGTPVDGVIALCMAHEAATAPEPPPSKMYLI